MIATTLTIERTESNSFTIRQGDRYADQLGWDEAIGLVCALMVPHNPGNLAWMKTAEQHQAFWDAMRLRQYRQDMEAIQ